MKEEEILKKAIEKAVDNGWAMRSVAHWVADCSTLANELIAMKTEATILYNHQFAKAFWGEGKRKKIRVGRYDHINEEHITRLKTPIPVLKWQYHLQQMVLEENPVLYLKQFLDD